MGLTAYRELLRIREVRRILVLSTLIRIPIWAAGVVLTLHVVGHLGRSYAEAGVAEMVLAVGLGVAGPWRGRRLDRIGLRATVAPSLVVLSISWLIAPWVGYLPLLGFLLISGIFVVPHFSIVRQVLIGAAPDDQRTAALSMDSVLVEVSFMVGPVLGVLAATTLPTPIALLGFQLLSVAGSAWLWVVDPPLPAASSDGPDGDERHAVRSWFTPAVAGILVVALAATMVLTGEDLGTVAALREMRHVSSIGWVLALWGLSSAIGGLVYGTLRRHPPSSVLIALLAASTLLVPLAGNRWQFAALLSLTGFFCAPTITATVDDLSRAVPAGVRGEAMGWQASALTTGGALGAPVVGFALDAGGWRLGFATTGVIGLMIAITTYAVTTRVRRAPIEVTTRPATLTEVAEIVETGESDPGSDGSDEGVGREQLPR